jgi:hypothetical protein
MNTDEAIRVASEHLRKLEGHEFDVIDVSKPRSIDEAVNLSRIISKLSPILGNLIEFNAVSFLNENPKFSSLGRWVRQDPDFPDALFIGKIDPAPGFEVKAWFPLATEITARFKDSQNAFADNATHVILLAWLPKFLVYGKPYILDVEVVSGLSIAKARDDHYHNPPDYLVLEPEDTESRTRNLQQTNTNGYKFQGSPAEFAKAKRFVESWGKGGAQYKPTRQYQAQLRQLLTKFPYRLDTNFAKIDRIAHPEIERFKASVQAMTVCEKTISAWYRILSSENETALRDAVVKELGIDHE